jgi:Fur family transcriptional regulator, ferric uptake regulator
MKDLEDLDEVESVRSLLKGADLRCTPARIAVLAALRKAKSPLTHADLSNQLVPHGFDKATVFRNLTDLTTAGLVHRTELGDRVWRFEIREHSETQSSHPHFLCVVCGAISCLETVTVSDENLRKSKIIGIVSEILVKGECVTCFHAK